MNNVKVLTFPLIDFAAMNVLCEAQRHYDTATPASHLAIFYVEMPEKNTLGVQIFYPICRDCEERMREIGTNNPPST